MIPHIIHQIWIQGENNIPDKFKENVLKIKKMHLQWHYILWDDIAIINLLRNNKKLIDTYYKLDYLHQKVDFARYVILYLYGGIYIDMDAYTVKPLDSLFEKFKEYDLIVSKLDLNSVENYVSCNHNECLNNGVIISKKNSKCMFNIIKHIMNNLKCEYKLTKSICINDTTGPKMFTTIINKFKHTEKVLILDYEWLEPCKSNSNICNDTENTYVKHEHELSWCSENMTLFNYYYYNYKKSIYCTSLLLMIIIMFFIIKNISI